MPGAQGRGAPSWTPTSRCPPTPVGVMPALTCGRAPTWSSPRGPGGRALVPTGAGTGHPPSATPGSCSPVADWLWWYGGHGPQRPRPDRCRLPGRADGPTGEHRPGLAVPDLSPDPTAGARPLSAAAEADPPIRGPRRPRSRSVGWAVLAQRALSRAGTTRCPNCPKSKLWPCS